MKNNERDQSWLIIYQRHSTGSRERAKWKRWRIEYKYKDTKWSLKLWLIKETSEWTTKKRSVFFSYLWWCQMDHEKTVGQQDSTHKKRIWHSNSSDTNQRWWRFSFLLRFDTFSLLWCIWCRWLIIENSIIRIIIN